jgi:hypothetical protein
MLTFGRSPFKSSLVETADDDFAAASTLGAAASVSTASEEKGISIPAALGIAAGALLVFLAVRE